MAKNTLLEVDDSIITKTLTLPEKDEEEKKFTELLNSLSHHEKPSMLIKPSPGVCIKVKTENGEKTFVNVCTSSEIPPPEDISQETLIKICMDDDTSYVIPMSIGQERLETDKGGVPTPTYDVVINTAYFEKCKKIKSFWVFTLTVIIDGVSHKFNKSLSPKEHVVLKNRKVVGTLQEHRIEKREPRKPSVPCALIEEIGETKNVKNQLCDKNDDALEYVILKNKHEKDSGLIGLFKIPSLSLENMNLDIGEDRLIVEDCLSNRSIDIFLPHTIDQEHVSASMDNNIGILRVYLPLRS